MDEIEEKPKTVFSALCNRWLSITGVSKPFAFVLNSTQVYLTILITSEIKRKQYESKGTQK